MAYETVNPATGECLRRFEHAAAERRPRRGQTALHDLRSGARSQTRATVTSTMPADLLLLFARLLVCTVFIVSAVDKFNPVPAQLAAMRALKLSAPVFLMRLTGVCEIVGCL